MRAFIGTSSPTVGTQVPERTFGPITRSDIVRYAGASGDFNPIHHDEGFAQAAGFATVFSMGMLQAGLLATYATDWAGAANIRKFTVRFREQVWPGDLLTCRGSVSGVVDTKVGLQVDLELECVRQTGAKAVAGSAMFILDRSMVE